MKELQEVSDTLSGIIRNIRSEINKRNIQNECASSEMVKFEGLKFSIDKHIEDKKTEIERGR